MTSCHFIPHVCHNETYWFIYDPTSIIAVYHQLQRWAENPELSFSWVDAGKVLDKMQALQEERRERQETAARTPLGKEVFRGGIMPPRGFFTTEE